MKKMLSILACALLLCTAIPMNAISFATVSAADVPTIVASTVAEANAGDEIQVEVSLMGNPGVNAALIEIVYDKDVFELVSYYDEDEDETYNMIEVASGWKSSCITFGPVGKCTVLFTNGTASKDVTKELFFTATFKIKDDAQSGTYELTVKHDNKNFTNVAGDQVDFAAQHASVKVNGASDPEPIYGDVNGDGKVNNRDLGVMQKYLNGFEITIDEKAADLTGDGKINNRDLGALQKHLNA